MVEAGRGTVSRFDEPYYLAQSGAVRERARERFLGSALLDYLWVGARERRNPTAGFDEAYYLASNPDVAAALGSSAFVCGYHHYLKNGEAEGRRGVPPGPCCAIDAGRTPAGHGRSAAGLAAAIQRVRPGWRVLVLAGSKLPAGAGLHPWVEWVVVPPKPSDALARTEAGRPAYVVILGEPTSPPPEGAAVVALAERPEAGKDRGRGSCDAVVPWHPGAGAGAAGADLALAAERIVVALETVEQVRRAHGRTRLAGGGADAAVGTGVSIMVAAGDGDRAVRIVIDLPPVAGVSRENLVTEVDGEPVALEPAVGRPAQTVVRIGAAPARILVRPRKAGYRAVSRVVLARVEAAPVDLVPAPLDTDAPADALAVIELNAELTRVKQALGRFLTRADSLIEERPAYQFGLPAVPRLAPIASPRCLVVSTFDVERSWTGRDTLDVAAWREYLDARGFAVDVLELPPGTASDVGRLRKQDLTDHRFLVLAGPRSPALFTEGLERAAHVSRLYRGAVSGDRLVDRRLRAADLACARAADRVIVAGPADAAYYRAEGVPPGRLDYVPEFLPSVFRQLSRPYPSRPRQAVVHVDPLAALEGRLRAHAVVRDAVDFLLSDGWRVVISVAPRLRLRLESDLGLQAGHPSLAWCDPALDLPAVLHATRLVLAPAVHPAELGGLTTAARILGFRILVDGPGGQGAAGHRAALPRSMSAPGALGRLDRDPGSLDMEAVRAEAFRSLDRVLGFRDAGWQEGRHDRSPDI